MDFTLSGFIRGSLAVRTLTFAVCLGRARFIERLDLDIAKFDAVSLGFEPEVPLGNVALVPLIRHGSVDPEGHVAAARGNFEGVPLAGRFDPRAALAAWRD